MIKLIVINDQSFYIQTLSGRVGDFYQIKTTSIDDMIIDLERGLEVLREVKSDIENEKFEKHVAERKAVNKTNEKWWNENKADLVYWLRPGMKVKFRGTKDGLGLREILEINGENITGFKFKPGYRLQVRKTEDIPKGWVNMPPEKTLETTTNGIEKLTHIFRGDNKISVKDYMKQKTEWS